MAQNKSTATPVVGQLFFVPNDAKMARILEEGLNLLRAYPEIANRIRVDQDAVALAKKALREQDRQWETTRGIDPLPNMEPVVAGGAAAAGSWDLQSGCPRMKPEVVYIFFLLRGTYGSVTSQAAYEIYCDSKTLEWYLQYYTEKIPGRTTILENVNSMSLETRDFILDRQLLQILGVGLDDFKDLMIDSTDVDANSAWPNDSDLILKYLERAYDLSQKLSIFDQPEFRKWHCPRWFKKLNRLAFEVNVSSAKKKKKLRKAYRNFLACAEKLLGHLSKEYDRLDETIAAAAIRPSHRQRLLRCWDMILDSLCNADQLIDLAHRRVIEGEKITREEHEKIYSISDRCAAFIRKGQRKTTFGYRPQLTRSANGFITSAIVPLGNCPDSKMLVPVVEDHIRLTGVIPTDVSTDDGYSSELGRSKLLELGVKHVSISGSKGKRITPEEDWNSPLYADLRRRRSAVESLMFTTKFHFDLGQFHRRGHQAVREELLEKVIAHNFWRMALQRDRAAAA